MRPLRFFVFVLLIGIITVWSPTKRACSYLVRVDVLLDDTGSVFSAQAGDGISRHDPRVEAAIREVCRYSYSPVRSRVFIPVRVTFDDANGQWQAEVLVPIIDSDLNRRIWSTAGLVHGAGSILLNRRQT